MTDAACLLLGAVEHEDRGQIQDRIISYGRTAVERITVDPDNLIDLATDAGNARAQWFDEFMTEAHSADRRRRQIPPPPPSRRSLS